MATVEAEKGCVMTELTRPDGYGLGDSYALHMATD
jgi:hypothetical protein